MFVIALSLIYQLVAALHSWLKGEIVQLLFDAYQESIVRNFNFLIFFFAFWITVQIFFLKKNASVYSFPLELEVELIHFNFQFGQKFR